MAVSEPVPLRFSAEVPGTHMPAPPAPPAPPVREHSPDTTMAADTPSPSAMADLPLGAVMVTLLRFRVTPLTAMTIGEVMELSAV